MFERQTFEAIVAAFGARRVLVVGDVMLDEYVWGEVRRISPEAPVPVVEARRRTSTPGGAANVACNVASLGGRAALCGVVGGDASAAHLRELLERRGVSADGLIVDEGRPTTTKTRVVAHSQQVARVDSECRAPLSAEVEEALLSRAVGGVAWADVCVLSDYDKGVVTPRVAQGVIEAARAAGRPVIVDPKGCDYAKYRRATVVTPNVHEAERATGHEIVSEADVAEVARLLTGALEGCALLLTRGARGMSLFAGGEAAHIPAVARNVYDVTGAGDTVVSALALALASGAPLEEAVRLANSAAGVVVGKLGTAQVTAEELIEGWSGGARAASAAEA